MARRKTTKKEEVDTTVETEETPEATEATEATEELEVTDEFHLQEVSDTGDSYEAIMEAGLTDVDTTEVEAVIEDGADIEVVEEKETTKPKPSIKRNRTTKDEKVDASKILAAQAEKEAQEAKIQRNQRLPRVRPNISKAKSNNGIRTTQGLFSR